MDILKPLIEERLKLLNSVERKESLEDVVFTISSLNNQIEDCGIYITPYADLENKSDKEIIMV